jgi:hypothetical protein
MATLQPAPAEGRETALAAEPGAVRPRGWFAFDYSAP